MRAFRYAVTLASDYGADISVIQIVEPKVYNRALEGDESQRNVTFAERALVRLAKIAREEIPFSIHVNPWVQIGSGYEQISSAAKAVKADLIVISANRYAGVQDAICGNTTEQVVRQADCPVLVVGDSIGTEQKG